MLGWQFWPLAGRERLEPSTRTNIADEVEIVPGHDKTFALWPIYFRDRLALGTTNASRVDAVVPFYYRDRAPLRDYTAVLWPFVSWSDDRAEKYRQWSAPWPLVSFARGEGKTMDRVLPFFSVGHNATLRSETYLWPLYRRNRLQTENYERDRRQIAIHLYSDTRESRRRPGTEARRIQSWPFFTWGKEADGKERLQVLALFEPFSRGEGIVRNWSPLWSLWRDERDPLHGRRSQSLFWNLYRLDATAEATRRSLLFGLIQHQDSAAGDHWRFLHLGPKLTLPAAGLAPTNPPNDVPEHR